VNCGLHRIERLMRQHGLKARRRRLPPDICERQAAAVAPNVLDRAFVAPAPNRRWIADFTYNWTAEGRLYVAAVVDLFSRRFVENAEEADVQTLRAALDETAACYEHGDPERILDAKTHFYDALVAGARSESLSAMLSTLHARIWRWRALGLSHPSRSPTRSRESIDGLRAMFDAILARHPVNAERCAREETDRAAIEVFHVLGTG
jgi:transposase InsO family protein